MPEEAAPCGSAYGERSISGCAKGSGGRPGSQTRLWREGRGGGQHKASVTKGWGSRTQAALGDLMAQARAHLRGEKRTQAEPQAPKADPDLAGTAGPPGTARAPRSELGTWVSGAPAHTQAPAGAQPVLASVRLAPAPSRLGGARPGLEAPPLSRGWGAPTQPFDFTPEGPC